MPTPLYDVSNGDVIDHIDIDQVIDEMKGTSQAAAGVTMMPPGAIIDFAGSSAPAGWHLADGSAISRSTYARLFAVIGTTYGAGDGSTTFNVPDMRGLFALGAGSGYALDAIGGETTHALTEPEGPYHTHGASVGDAGSGSPHGWGAFQPGSPGAYPGLYGDGSHPPYFYKLVLLGIPTVTVAPTGGGVPHNNMPPYRALNKIIRL